MNPGSFRMSLQALGARQRILEWEAENAARLREAGQLRDPTKHVRP